MHFLSQAKAAAASVAAAAYDAAYFAYAASGGDPYAPAREANAAFDAAYAAYANIVRVNRGGHDGFVL